MTTHAVKKKANDSESGCQIGDLRIQPFDMGGWVSVAVGDVYEILTHEQALYVAAKLQALVHECRVRDVYFAKDGNT